MIYGFDLDVLVGVLYSGLWVDVADVTDVIILNCKQSFDIGSVVRKLKMITSLLLRVSSISLSLLPHLHVYIVSAFLITLQDTPNLYTNLIP